MNIRFLATVTSGLVTGVSLANSRPYTLLCMDVESGQESAKLENGQIPIYEPGWNIVRHRSKAGRFGAFNDQTLEKQ